MDSARAESAMGSDGISEGRECEGSDGISEGSDAVSEGGDGINEGADTDASPDILFYFL